MNQTPVLKGINDHPAVLSELLDRLSLAGVTPYYFFVNRPVTGNREFVLPLAKVYQIVEEAKARTSGFSIALVVIVGLILGVTHIPVLMEAESIERST